MVPTAPYVGGSGVCFLALAPSCHPSPLPRHTGRDTPDAGPARAHNGGTAYWMDDGADTGPMEMRDWCLDAFHLADRVPVQCADPGAADLSYFVFDHDRPS